MRCPLGMLGKRSSPMRQAEDRTRWQKTAFFNPGHVGTIPDEGMDLLPHLFGIGEHGRSWVVQEPDSNGNSVAFRHPKETALSVKAFESDGDDQVWSFFLDLFLKALSRGAPSASSRYGKRKGSVEAWWVNASAQFLLEEIATLHEQDFFGSAPGRVRRGSGREGGRSRWTRRQMGMLEGSQGAE